MIPHPVVVHTVVVYQVKNLLEDSKAHSSARKHESKVFAPFSLIDDGAPSFPAQLPET